MVFNSIGKRIAFGFGIMVSTLILSGAFSIWLSVQLADIGHRIREVGGPTVNHSQTVLNGINQTQSALKSWLLLHRGEYRESRQEAWASSIDPAMESLSALSPDWVDPADVEAFRQAKIDLDEIRAMQERLEKMSPEQSAQASTELDGVVTPRVILAREKLERLIQSKNALMDRDLQLQDHLNSRLRILQGLLIALGLLTGALMSYLLIRGITVPIQQTIDLADKIADGNYDQVASITGTDEVNRLGLALERMRARLQEKTWLNQSQILFNERIRASASAKELADFATSAIAECLPMLSGVVYSVEEARLKAVGGFALPQGKLPGLSFQLGQGLTGQAAASRRLVVIPGKEGALEIETAVGDAAPQEIAGVPLLYKEELAGVLELSFSRRLKEHELDFVRLSSEAAAVVLSTVQQAEKIKNLLQETQAQTEELQLQQEELKAANDELQTRQEELRATNEELEAQKRTLDLKNSELEMAQQAVAERAEELDRVSKYKSEFLANMSHELRTPLNSQLVLARLLSDNKDGNLTEKQVEFARTIFSTGQDLLKLINDILDLSKVEAGKLELDVREVRVSDVVSDLQRDFEHIAAQKGLDLEVELAKNVPATILTDSHRLGQILRNLASNAFKFTTQGKISVRAFPAGGDKPGSTPQVAFAVSDTGIGIPESHREAVFQAFEQVDSSIGRKYGGTGLGLSISSNLATLLGGKIRVESQVGKGSTFTLYVPVQLTAERAEGQAVRAAENLSPLAVQMSPPSAERADSARRYNSILIIEDDIRFARVLSDLAEEEGFRPTITRDGADGLEQAYLGRPACILLDYRLPRLDGLRILKELKGNPATRHIPIYMISIDDQGLEAQKLGAMGYLLKPADPDQIRQVLRRLKATIRGATRNVLVVEDSNVQLEHIVQTIGNGSVKCKGVGSAKEAYAELTGETVYDCMVLDLTLPDENGLEFLQRAHTDSAVRLPPVVIYTSRDLTRDEEEKLRKFSETIIIKGARSSERLLDEVSLFTHRIVGEMPEDKRRAVEEAYRRGAKFQGKSVLLVDDEVRNIFALSSALEGTGLKVSFARNGQEAVSALESSPRVNLVLMDIMMPVMDGYEAMKRIRAMEKFKTLPIIALTAKAMKEDRRLCLEAGASDYLAKPVDLERLFSLLRVWLGA